MLQCRIARWPHCTALRGHSVAESVTSTPALAP
jgi:hypothetical protein